MLRTLWPCSLAVLKPERFDLPLLNLVGKVDDPLGGGQLDTDADPLCMMWPSNEGCYGIRITVPPEFGNVRDDS